MIDDEGNANVIQFGSNLCERVAMSVMDAEAHEIVLGFYFSFIIRYLMEEVLGRQVVIEAYFYRETVLNLVSNDGKTAGQ